MSSYTILLLVAAVWCGLTTAETPNYRLTRNVIPYNYEIKLKPYLEATATKKQFTFDGTAIIRLNTSMENQKQIILHASDLTFVSMILNRVGMPSSRIEITSNTRDTVTEKLTLNLAEPLVVNTQYALTFEYTGNLQSDMNGFYRSSYMENGVLQWAASTQMEPTYARKVFPCFDEPSFKATFDIAITRPNDYVNSISNTQILESNGNFGEETTTEKFSPTPIMSTYLIAFIVSKFKVRLNDAKTFGVIARPDAYDQTEYAFDVGQKTLAKLDEYVDYPYLSVNGIKKMHMAALPDFSAGAMENWGLLTFRETALLYDQSESTHLAQQRVASVITHEQAHMWFGDLVTCEWWKYTWLNEGFARFFQYFGTAMVETTWDLDLQFVVEQLHTAMLFDSQESTHPMTHDVNTPAEIDGIFDNISYNKGASVLRMIQHLMGADNFRNALRAYLKEHQFGVSTPEKLFASLQTLAPQTPIKLDIAATMTGWTTQTGYPVVTFNRTDDMNVVISQERFFLKNRVAGDSTRWVIPLTYATQESPSFASTAAQVILNSSQASTNLMLEKASTWTVVNVQQTGYYRVNYDEASWMAIHKALRQPNYSGIHVLNRAQIVDDVLNLARAEYINYTLALGVVQYLENETNYTPWLAAFNNLNYVSLHMSGNDLTLYQNHIVNMTKFIYVKLGFNPMTSDTRLDVYNRAQILQLLCKYGHADCIKKSNEEFAKLSNATYSIPPNIRPVVYCSVVANETAGAWDKLFERFKTSNSAAEQVVILSALGCTKNNATLERYLNAIFTDDVRLQDKASAFAATYGQQNSNLDYVMNYVIANHIKISGSMGVAGIMSTLAGRFTNQGQIEKLVAFQATNSSYNTTGVDRAIQGAKFNLYWSQKHVPVIVKYINDYNSASHTTSAVLLLAFAALVALFH